MKISAWEKFGLCFLAFEVLVIAWSVVFHPDVWSALWFRM